MSDPLLTALRRGEQTDAAMALLKRGPWNPARCVRYRLMGYGTKRIAELAEVDVEIIEIVLNERGLM